MTPTNSVGDDRFLRVTIDAEPVSEVLSRAPGVAYFWLRKFLFGAFVDHRLTWLRAKGTKFGRRGGADSKAIKVWPINQGPVPPGPADVVYQVQPAPERVASAAEAATQLPQLAAEAFTGNEVLPTHEFGADITSKGKLLAIPIKTQPGSLRLWREQHPGAKLRILPSKRDNKLLVFEVLSVRPRGRPRKDAPPVPKTRLRLRWLLTREITLRPTLRMYETWDGLKARRDDFFAHYATRMAEQMASGRTA